MGMFCLFAPCCQAISSELNIQIEKYKVYELLSKSCRFDLSLPVGHGVGKASNDVCCESQVTPIVQGCCAVWQQHLLRRSSLASFDQSDSS